MEPPKTSMRIKTRTVKTIFCLSDWELINTSLPAKLEILNMKK
jgi:hypothetical protein